MAAKEMANVLRRLCSPATKGPSFLTSQLRNAYSSDFAAIGGHGRGIGSFSAGKDLSRSESGAGASTSSPPLNSTHATVAGGSSSFLRSIVMPISTATDTPSLMAAAFPQPVNRVSGISGFLKGMGILHASGLLQRAPNPPSLFQNSTCVQPQRSYQKRRKKKYLGHPFAIVHGLDEDGEVPASQPNAGSIKARNRNHKKRMLQRHLATAAYAKTQKEQRGAANLKREEERVQRWKFRQFAKKYWAQQNAPES